MKVSQWFWRVIIITFIAGAQGRKTPKERRRGSSKSTHKAAIGDPNDDVPGWFNTNDILEAVGAGEYGIPKQCNKKELEATIKRCVLIWKKYCECEHCKTSCKQEEWPPAETQSWGYQRPDVGWRQLEDAWKWAGKCAYNATNLWRIWCGQGDVVDGPSGVKKTYKYWFLVTLDNRRDLEEIEDMCYEQECPDRDLGERPVTPTSMLTPKGSNSVQIGLTDRQDVMDAMGPNLANQMFPSSCNNEVLSTYLHRCTVVWRNYCKCAGCHMPCDENQWPPEEVDSWGENGRKIGWEEREDAWKWAAKCAFNATYLWRTICYVRSPDAISDEMFDEPEHEYWFLTELSQDSHPKVIQSLCESNECHKFTKELLKTELDATTTASIRTKTVTFIASPSSSTSGKVPSEPKATMTVPKWAYIIIAVLGAIVILLVVFTVVFLHHRSQSKTVRSHHKRSRNPQRPATIDNSSSWQPPSSFSYFEERALPVIGEGIYHTITADPPPYSPSFEMASFSTDATSPKPNEMSARGKSVRNVLYHDTTPRYSNFSSTRFPAFAPDNDRPHTYEDTVPEIPSLPPDTPPYFVPTGEYGTIDDTGPTSQRDVGENQRKKDDNGNYDRIVL